MKHLIQWLPALLALVVVTAAQAVPAEVYRGVLGGTAEVVLEFNAGPAGEVKKGRYFYRRHGVDIPLRGLPKALAEGLPLDHIEETAGSDDRDNDGAVFKDPGTGKPRIVWAGRLEGDRYTGTWHDAKTGKSLPFSLKRVATYDPDKTRSTGVEAVTKAIVQGQGSDLAAGSEISMANAPYNYLRANVRMTEGKEVVRGEVAYRMVTDPRTHVPYPRLTRHPRADMLARTNRLLEQRHWQMNLEALGCSSSRYTARGPSAGSLGGYDEENIQVDYLSPTLMSVVESGSTDCGGAHPNNHYEPYTLDLLRGGYFDFARILKGYGHGDYTPEYSDAFMRFLRAALKREAAGAEPVDLDCADEWPSYLYLHFTAPDQLSFDISGIGHAMGVCLGSHLTLPFSKLKPILKPEAARYLGNKAF